MTLSFLSMNGNALQIFLESQPERLGQSKKLPTGDLLPATPKQAKGRPSAV
jgi:hypothetical protein